MTRNRPYSNHPFARTSPKHPKTTLIFGQHAAANTTAHSFAHQPPKQLLRGNCIPNEPGYAPNPFRQDILRPAKTTTFFTARVPKGKTLPMPSSRFHKTNAGDEIDWLRLLDQLRPIAIQKQMSYISTSPGSTQQQQQQQPKLSRAVKVFLVVSTIQQPGLGGFYSMLLQLVVIYLLTKRR
ncbi:hypothetical protein M406DRAFT_68653 [Cryphonectria parasitica EP155]|uniref:Uncharacterized protein n=1 Tax=Cryphonectria parasitica (strain ATCC 38755 / EP155) TaxID=660469 RepID=A0A9P5CPB1_CRYP1|nr:uncharacterized protein M406DRAFT_68653 [Cryphonectria parasitica EP155]KAF3766294.1 hypothetical protein M406DRAFT_68653 [Cryphonectria parasitica EP155]